MSHAPREEPEAEVGFRQCQLQASVEGAPEREDGDVLNEPKRDERRTIRVRHPEAPKRGERAAKDTRGEYPVLPGVAGMSLEHPLVEAHLLPGIHVPEPEMLHLHGDRERGEEDHEENVCSSGAPGGVFRGRAVKTRGRHVGDHVPWSLLLTPLT